MSLSHKAKEHHAASFSAVLVQALLARSIFALGDRKTAAQHAKEAGDRIAENIAFTEEGINISLLLYRIWKQAGFEQEATRWLKIGKKILLDNSAAMPTEWQSDYLEKVPVHKALLSEGLG